MRIKTHPLSVTHLVVGLVFLGIAGSWALRVTNNIDARDLTWMFPLALVVAGGVGLVAAMAKGVRGRTSQPELRSEYVEPLSTEYDQPLRPDYTSDLDRKLSEAEKTAVITTDTTPIDTSDETKENDR